MGGYDSAQIADLVGSYILNTQYKLDTTMMIVFYTSQIVMVLSVLMYKKRL